MVPRIQIQNVPARIQLTTGPARVTTTNRPATISISAPDPSVEVQGGSATLEINWRQTRNEMDLVHYMDFQRRYRDDSLQAGLQGIARIVSEGNTIGDIENGGAPISAIAMEVTNHEISFGIGFTPRTPPDITVTVRQPRVSGNAPGVDIRPQIYPAVHRVIPTPVNIDTAQRPEVNIDFLGQFVDLLAT